MNSAGSNQEDALSGIGADRASVSKRTEFFAFIVLAVLLAPVLAVASVGGYGFALWMLQLIFGPPTI